MISRAADPRNAPIDRAHPPARGSPIWLNMPPSGPIAGRSPADRDRAAEHAADALRRGETAVLPTETVYGIFAPATSTSVDHLDSFTVKPETGTGPRATLHLPDLENVLSALDLPHATTRRLLERLCPGPVRFVIDQPRHSLTRLRDAVGVGPELVDDSARVAFRVPDHPIARRVLREAGVPCVARRLGAAYWALGDDPGTSCTIIPDDAEPSPGIVVDDGTTLHGEPSTTIRIDSDGRIAVDPGGVLSERAVMEHLDRLILFVCTGNTCRSPMAERIARAIDADTPASGITTRFGSAGIAAADGMPATPEADEALRQRGIEPTEHRSRALTPALIDEAEIIFTMTPSHAEAIMHAAPDAAHKVFPLADAEPVEDPIGQGPEVYRCDYREAKGTRTKCGPTLNSCKIIRFC